jgi:hypothetical protein
VGAETRVPFRNVGFRVKGTGLRWYVRSNACTALHQEIKSGTFVIKDVNGINLFQVNRKP